jgi:hypothetical protein
VNLDLGEVLARAWQITRKHKVLWVFNMFPLMISFLFVPIVFIPMFYLGPNALMHQGFVSRPSYSSLFLNTDIFLAAISMIFYAAGSASASIGILRVENGRVQLFFRELLEEGLRYFWRILGVTMLIGGSILAVFLILFGCIVLISTATKGLAMLCIQPLFVFIYPIALIVYALVEESQAALIADQTGIVDAIVRAWSLVKLHFWKFVLLSLLIYFGLLILGSIVTLPWMAPFIFLRVGSFRTGSNFQSFGWTLMLLSLILLPVLAIVQGFTMTFMKAAYMLVYLRLTRSAVL